MAVSASCGHTMAIHVVPALANWLDPMPGLRPARRGSSNGPSAKQATSLQWTAHLPPNDFTIELIHFELPRSRHLSTPNNGP